MAISLVYLNVHKSSLPGLSSSIIYLMDRAKPLRKGRTQLSKVLQVAGELVSVDAVTKALEIDRRRATKLLARWATQGWVKRLRRGLYAPVPIASLGQTQVLDDPWLVVPSLFGPAYIGGWTAAEHWGLTEQIFRSVCVLTTRPVHGKEKNVQGVDFSAKRISRQAMFGMKTLWRGKVKVEVSSPSKTIIDMLDDPAIGGGIRHVSDCLNEYLNEKKGTPEESDEHRSTPRQRRRLQAPRISGGAPRWTGQADRRLSEAAYGR